MFRRLADLGHPLVKLTVDGTEIEAREGDTVAAALLAAGLSHTRESPVTNAPRAPYCMMGVCFECVVIVDGISNRQGCLVEVRPGMRVETVKGRREIGT